MLIPLLALLALAGIVLGGIQLFGDPSETATTRPIATTPPAPSTSVSPSPSVRLVSLTAGDYLGHPLSEVQSALTALGFTVSAKPLQTSDVPDGQVIAVDPTGPLPRGTAITVTYAVAPPPPPTPTAAPSPSISARKPSPAPSSMSSPATSRPPSRCWRGWSRPTIPASTRRSAP